MRLASALLLLTALATTAHAQTLSVKGRFLDSSTNAPVTGVSVKLVRFTDSTEVQKAVAKDDGTFEVKGLSAAAYRLTATRVGFGVLRQVVRVNKSGQDLGELRMTTEALEIKGVTITESPAPAAQKADTTEFRASAVKVQKDATAEELVQKMPGVTVENGQVKAQGENVQQVLVNGRPFFGSDPAAAMRNLPAEVVDRIQVYDRASDQAEFSGFEDGNQQKTMNFILRNQKAKFGKVYGGYGDQDRYQAGGNATWLKGANRITLIGLSNNVNQRNFSPMDLFGALSGGQQPSGGMRTMMMMGGGNRGGGGGGMGFMRMGGGGFGGGGFDPSSFFVNQQGGISTTHSGGVNYVGQWGPKLSVSSSLFVNDTDNSNDQSVARAYTPAQDSLAFFDQTSTSNNRNRNQRFDARFEWTIDSLNSVILQPRLYFQQNRSASDNTSLNTSVSNLPLSSSTSETENHTTGENLSNKLTVRHRFAKKGRNVSAEFNIGRNSRDGDRDQVSVNTFGLTPPVTRDQQTASKSTTDSWSTRIAFTEPLAPGWQAQLTYSPAGTRAESDAQTLRFNPLTTSYDLIDSTQSNTFVNRTRTQNGGGAVLRTFGPWRWLTQASLQRTTLASERSFPSASTFEYTFEDVLPSMTLSGSFANRRNVRLAWTTSTTPPSINQLQDVVDNSNPLSLSSGNPDLQQTYTHNLSFRMSEADPFKSKSRFVFFNVSSTSDPIANSTTTDSVGRQFTRPVNLDRALSVNAFAAYSMPAKFLKSILSLNGGLSFNETPAELDQVISRTRTTSIRGGSVLASNISQNLDFTLSYQGNYNLSRSTLAGSDANDYYSHSIGLRFNAVVYKGIVFREELNHNYQGVPTGDFGQNVLLWNTTIGKKFLKNESGEFRLTASDVLRQERSVSRSFTDTYVQDSSDKVLGRYVQAVFSYSFR